jgi:hypothetical protein
MNRRALLKSVASAGALMKSSGLTTPAISQGAALAPLRSCGLAQESHRHRIGARALVLGRK